MKDIPPIKAVMTPFPYWVDIARPIADARAMMAEHDIRHLPVMEDGKLVSVVTDREIQMVLGAGPNPPEEVDLSVRDVCRRGAHVVGLAEPLDRVLRRMADEHLDSVLVVKDDKLAGIFTHTDACRHFGKLLRQLFPSGGDDEAA
jgi:acetoin utilization protein AcuB